MGLEGETMAEQVNDKAGQEGSGLSTRLQHLFRSSLAFDFPPSLRFKIYGVISAAIAFVAFMISFFHPIALAGHLIVGVGYGIAFGLPLLALSEVRILFLGRRGRGPDFSLAGFWGLGILIYLVGFCILGGFQLIFFHLETGLFQYYFDPSNGFIAFSFPFFLKMVPVLFLDGILALFCLKQFTPPLGEEKESPVCFRSGKAEYYFLPSTISHISIQEHYATIHCRDDAAGHQTLVKLSLARILDTLDDPRFFRTHRSHVVNLNHVAGFSEAEGNRLLIKGNGAVIPVSRRNLTPLKATYEEAMGQSLGRVVLDPSSQAD